jgi:Arc/MetJ family transcription regulator
VNSEPAEGSTADPPSARIPRQHGAAWGGPLSEADRRHPAVDTDGYIDEGVVYTEGLMKRLVDIDDDVLAAARTALGTDTIKATVNEALRLAAKQHRDQARSPLALWDWAQDRSQSALTDPEVMRGAWRG